MRAPARCLRPRNMYTYRRPVTLSLQVNAPSPNFPRPPYSKPSLFHAQRVASITVASLRTSGPEKPPKLVVGTGNGIRGVPHTHILSLLVNHHCLYIYVLPLGTRQRFSACGSSPQTTSFYLTQPTVERASQSPAPSHSGHELLEVANPSPNVAV